jgi:hypothetical protein
MQPHTLVQAKPPSRATKPLWVAAIWFILSPHLQPPLLAATIDVTQHGATLNLATDSAKAIQAAINRSAPGDTILFPAGIYAISTTLTLRSDRDYTGSNAILKRTGAEGFAACTESDQGKNMLVKGLTFDNGGVAFVGSGHVKAANIRIVDCLFTNITAKTYPYDQAIYIPIGAAECQFIGNHFRHIRGDNGLIGWNIDYSRITDNDFDDVNECMHLNGTCDDCVVLRNRGVHIHRMGIEIQGNDDANLRVEDNHFANWDAPFHDSFGLSIVPGNGPGIIVRYNTLLGRPPLPGVWTNRFGFGIELGGDVTCCDNFTEGYWWLGIVIGGKNTTVTHNLLRGPRGHDFCTPTKISLEPGSDKNTEIIADNQQIDADSFIETPTDLTAHAAGTRITLSWLSHSTKATGFRVERRIPDGDYSTIATLSSDKTSCIDEHVAAGVEYVYRIRAFTDAGDVTYSPSLLVGVPKMP